jgi:hypothetical protein
MKTLCSKLHLTRSLKTQNRAQQNDDSATLDGVTLTDSRDQVVTERLTDFQFAGWNRSVRRLDVLRSSLHIQSACALNTLYLCAGLDLFKLLRNVIEFSREHVVFHLFLLQIFVPVWITASNWNTLSSHKSLFILFAFHNYHSRFHVSTYKPLYYEL